MPYTPPAARSPTASRPTTPRYEPVLEQLPHGHGLKTGLPHSASSKAYLSKHRRSPSISDSSNTTGPFGSSGRESVPIENKGSDSEEERSKDLTSRNSRKSRHGATESSTASMTSPTGSPPHSSSDDESEKKRGRIRNVDNLAELQAAIRIIEQHRAGSPDGRAREDTKKARMALGLPAPRLEIPEAKTGNVTSDHRQLLTDTARKIAHSRSSTDTSAFIDFPRNKFDSPAPSTSVSDEGDDEEDEENPSLKPSLIRKKSGELVRPALRAPSLRRRPSSMPGTPTYSKAVHFQDSSLEHVRHFLQVDRPIAVSAGTSPVESTYDDDVEFPFSQAFDWEIRLTSLPYDPLRKSTVPVKLEKVYLSTDTKTLIGAVAVRNLAFHKLVVARFTLDYWKTTSEVIAEYNSDVRRKLTHDGLDRFTFSIKLEDQANLENKTMFFCIRYNVNGHDYWDNNNNLNYQIDFSKKFKQESSAKNTRPQTALPRSKPPMAFSNASPSMRPRSMPSFDDFASHMAPFEFLSSPQPAAMIGDSPIRFKNKAYAANVPPDALGNPNPSAGQQAFGNRYDFGASLSAAISAKTGAAKEKSESPLQPPARPVADIASAKPQTTSHTAHDAGAKSAGKSDSAIGARPAALTAEKPSMQSPTYEQLLNDYCFYGSATKPSTPRLKTIPKNIISQVDGSSENGPKARQDLHPPTTRLAHSEAWLEHAGHTVTDAKPAASPRAKPTSSPPSNSEERKPSSKITSPHTSRSASPANAMDSRAGSPSAFGYPYHQPMQTGFFDHTPTTAIRG